jgi:hypothetical protein
MASSLENTQGGTGCKQPMCEAQEATSRSCVGSGTKSRWSDQAPLSQGGPTEVVGCRRHKKQYPQHLRKMKGFALNRIRTMNIVVRKSDWFWTPFHPNQTSGFLASGSPVDRITDTSAESIPASARTIAATPASRKSSKKPPTWT